MIAALLLSPAGLQTVSTFIWRQFDRGSIALGMAMSGIVTVITRGLSFLVLPLTNKRPSGSTAP